MRGYQNIVIDGKDLGVRKRRKDSKFYNKGKWDNFIEPLLPSHCGGMTFIEFGCNLGMYLKMAKDKGFKALGVEADEYCCKMARKYSGCEVICNKIGNDRNFLRSLPDADYLLMSNFHYHITEDELANVLDIMGKKVRHIIVVSAENAKNRELGTRGHTRRTRKAFQEFKEVQYIGGLDYSDDEFPRRMFSILYDIYR